ncbi:MAG: MYXO-CTERM sorting domain-containing protein [Myxococcota bacterium]
MRFGPALLLLGAAAASPALANAPECGVDCARPGRVVLCNDSLLLGMPGQAVNCSASIGSCHDESYCESFNLPPGALPTHLRAVYAILGPVQANPDDVELHVYEETGQPAPGAEIAATATNSFGLIGDPSAVQALDLAHAQDAYALSGAFRVCLRKQFDGSHNVCMDATAASPGRTWMRAGAGTCAAPTGVDWRAASSFGLTGDFLIRPEIEVTDLAPWQPGGACSMRPDAGPAADAGVGPDAEVDAAVEDAAEAPDAALLDLGPAEDAAHGGDAAASDAPPIDPDAGLPDLGADGRDATSSADALTTQDAGGSTTTSGGCGCASSGQGAEPAVLAVALLVLTRRRGRRTS